MAASTEVKKLQQHLALLQEQYSALQAKFNDIQVKYQAATAEDNNQSTDFASRLLSMVGSLYNSSTYSDINIKLEDRTISAHKLVLSARSNLWNESVLGGKTELDWREVELEVAEAIILWLYKSQVRFINEDVTVKVVRKAYEFKLTALVESCERYLISTVTVRSCVRFYSVAEEIGAENLREYCSGLISAHWHDLNASDFEHMSGPLLNQMLKSKTQYPLHSAVRLQREDVVFLCLVENASKPLVKMTGFVVFKRELLEIGRDLEHLWSIENANLDDFATLKKLALCQKIFVVYTFVVWSMLVVRGFATGEMDMHFYQPQVVPGTLFIATTGCCLLYFFALIGFDFFFVSLAVILVVQYKILNRNLRHCLNTDIGNEAKCLADIKEAMVHRNLLNRIVEKTNRIFGPIMIAFVWIMKVMCGTIMYALYDRSDNHYNNYVEAVKYGSMLAGCAMEMVVLYIVPSQLLTDEMNNLFDVVYNSKWYECRFVSVQKSLLIISSGKPTQAAINAAGRLVELNFATCTSTFKTCFSMFTFLMHMK